MVVRTRRPCIPSDAPAAETVFGALRATPGNERLAFSLVQRLERTDDSVCIGLRRDIDGRINEVDRWMDG